MKRIKGIIKKENIKYFIVGIIIVLLLSLLLNQFKMSDLEKLTLKKYSDKMMTYMDVLEKDEIDYYVCYTMVYYKNEYNQNNVKPDEIAKFINNHFNHKVTKKQIEKLGITPYMIDQHITYNSINNEYIITTDELSRSDIAEIPVIKYEVEKIIKKSKNTYEITYSQYRIKNPYEVLNYYQDKKNSKAADEINLYLTGEGTKQNIYKYIIGKKIGKKTDTIKVEYLIDNQNIIVKRKK